MARLDLSRILTPQEIERIQSRLPSGVKTKFKIDKRGKGPVHGFVLINGNRKEHIRAVTNQIKQLGGVSWT